MDQSVVEWNPLAPFKVLSVFADAGFHSSEKTSTSNPPPLSYSDWNWQNFTVIEQYGNFSAKELGDIANEGEFSMEFLLTGGWKEAILRTFDEFTTDYKDNFIDSKSNPSANTFLMIIFLDLPFPPWNVMRTQTAFRAIGESFKSKTQLSDDILRRLNNFC